ncbi:glycosyltransferase family 39 protein [Streptomyces barringtoniae]|uniref:glycosyltransferase family 39 protein n=1 Tax=Streptomyces barringtoniae TaxID=2892029 RepID=UPI001E2B54BB|nr:glycosyltransferase family 39 protein [Streptomyces barringtoniae]MCC5477310.1 glycosyltransferase family 39 protein [Streptomyces barringtoniae]
MTSATDPLPHATTATPAPPAPDTAPPERAPRWSLPALLAILLLAAALYTWKLSGAGLNSFYSAAVYSGTQNWKAWFFGSLDAGNFLTVDKPPFADMVMSLSCRILGFGTWQMMLPEVAAGLATIWILHSCVKRTFGHAAAAVAALVLALTPITVAINRDNNPDTILVLLMVGGAALALRAVTNGRLLPLLGSAACFGLAFNTKMLAGYIALPAVLAVYLLAARPKLVRRIVNLLLAGVVLAVSSFWWAVAVSLVPASERPYIGGSTDGTAWNLITGYNGLGRIFGGEGNGGGGRGGGGGFSGSAGLGRMFNDILGGQISWLLPFSAVALVAGLILCGRAPRTDRTRAALVLWGGWTVLHYVTFATAEGTMHPYYTTALAPGIAALCGGGGVMLLRAFRTDRRWAWALPAGLAVTAVWSIVLLRRAAGWNTWLWPTVGVVMAAAIAGLFVFRSGKRVRLLAASVAAAVVAALAGPAAYAWSVPSGSVGGMRGTNPTAGPSTGGGFGGPGGGRGFGGGGFPGGGELPGQSGGTAPGGSASGAPGGASGGVPGGASGGQMPSGGQQSGGFPGGELPGGQGTPGGTASGGTGAPSGGSAGPGGRMGTGMGGGMMRGANSELIAYLKKHQDGATWLLAVSNSQSAAQIELSARVPVISMWGFTGTDQAMTVAKLEELVKKGELHYIQLGGGMMGGGPGGNNNSVSSLVTAWVMKHGTLVKESAYSKSATSSTSKQKSSSSSSSSSSSANQSTIYRLDPSDVS